jgi:hypothetical protein
VEAAVLVVTGHRRKENRKTIENWKPTENNAFQRGFSHFWDQMKAYGPIVLMDTVSPKSLYMI